MSFIKCKIQSKSCLCIKNQPSHIQHVKADFLESIFHPIYEMMTIPIRAKIDRWSPFARSPVWTPEIPEKRLTIKFKPENGLNAVEIDQTSKRSNASPILLIPNSAGFNCMAKAPTAAIW